MGSFYEFCTILYHHYVLAKMLYNGAKVTKKTNPSFQKSHEEFGQLQASNGMSKKLKFDGLLLHKKYILSGKHAEDLSNITFNYFLCIFLDQTLHNLDERSPSKYKFSDFPLLLLKFTKFLTLTFKQEVSFSSKFGSFFSVMRDISSVLFFS